jgi:hypothetical protein
MHSTVLGAAGAFAPQLVELKFNWARRMLEPKL